MTIGFYYSVLPFVPLRQKGGVIFIFGLGMYFQTGQVIFVPEWPKGEFVSIWTKSLMRKDAVNRDSTCQSIFRRLCTAKKIEDFKVPISHPDDRAIPSGRPSVTVPYVRTTCHTVRTPDRPRIIRPDDMSLCLDPPLCREGSIQPASVRMFQQHVRTPLSTRTVLDSFQVPIKGRSINRPNDVVSRPDARLLKARIAIQISPSGRLTAVVGTRVHQRRKLPI
jgi:hypothetical protein